MHKQTKNSIHDQFPVREVNTTKRNFNFNYQLKLTMYMKKIAGKFEKRIKQERTTTILIFNLVQNKNP